MRIIDTSKINPDDLSGFEKDQVYNGLDVCCTAEILDELLPQLDNITAATYNFSRALQGPVLEMRLRGVLIDQARKAEVIQAYHEKIEVLEAQLERIVGEGCGFWGFNWRSPDHLRELFFERMQIPVVRKKGRPTTDRNALEKIKAYLVARPVVAHMIALREIGKKISMLKTAIDPDGRMRTSYNIAGTDTYRFSSSVSEFGTGGNLQNIEDHLRQIFIADPGMKLAYIDARQIQSRIVGAIEWNLFKDGRYLDACEGGDLHTTVARLCWPRLPWTGRLEDDVAVAETPYYRHYTFRFMCKKIGHGTNFGGKPHTISQQAKIEIEAIQEFQPKYFLAFPTHLMWHAHTERTIREEGTIYSITGCHKRQFWGRRDSDDTVRAALAFDPQCTEAFIINNGMLNTWRNRTAELLLQNHDAVVVQYPEEKEDEVIPRLLKELEHPVPLEHDRTLLVPYDCQVGWNWGHISKDNPDGLQKYRPGDKRKRSPAGGILDRKPYKSSSSKRGS